MLFMSDFLQPHELYHARLPYPSPFPGACSNSYPSSWWCHQTISSFASTFSFCRQSFPAWGSFPKSWLFASRGEKYWSFSLSISASNEYSWLISFRIDKFAILAVQGTRESFLAPKFKSINYLVLSLLYGPTLTSVLDYWKNHSFD